MLTLHELNDTEQQNLQKKIFYKLKYSQQVTLIMTR